MEYRIIKTEKNCEGCAASPFSNLYDSVLHDSVTPSLEQGVPPAVKICWKNFARTVIYKDRVRPTANVAPASPPATLDLQPAWKSRSTSRPCTSSARPYPPSFFSP